MPHPQELFTAGQMAEQLEEPVSRVTYIIRKYRIKPVSRVGIIRQFTEEQVNAIKDGLYELHI